MIKHPANIATPKACAYLRASSESSKFEIPDFWDQFELDVDSVISADGRRGWDALLTDPDHPGSPYARKLLSYDHLSLSLGSIVGSNQFNIKVLITYYHEQPRSVDHRLRLHLTFDVMQDKISALESSFEN